MTNDSEHDDTLESFFTAARKTPAPPGAALQARVLADADRLQPKAVGQAANACQAGRRRVGFMGWLRALFGDLGGVPGAAGLASAAIAGIWFGAFSSETLAVSVEGAFWGGGQDYVIDFDPLAVLTGAEGEGE